MRTEEDRRKAFGRYVRRCRYRIGNPPQETVARAAGISRQYLSFIERGEWPKNPTEDLLRGLALALGRPFVEVLMEAFGANGTASEPMLADETVPR